MTDIAHLALIVMFVLAALAFIWFGYNMGHVDGRLEALDQLGDTCGTPYATLSKKLESAHSLLRACARQFREYERQHTAKGTPEADEKAAVNATWARECEVETDER